jgi:hypothetical protein
MGQKRGGRKSWVAEDLRSKGGLGSGTAKVTEAEELLVAGGGARGAGEGNGERTAAEETKPTDASESDIGPDGGSTAGERADGGGGGGGGGGGESGESGEDREQVR